jgi:hypothetical protein
VALFGAMLGRCLSFITKTMTWVKQGFMRRPRKSLRMILSIIHRIIAWKNCTIVSEINQLVEAETLEALEYLPCIADAISEPDPAGESEAGR